MTTPTTLERPVYGMSQAARLLGLRTDALRRWVDGYERASPAPRDRRLILTMPDARGGDAVSTDGRVRFAHRTAAARWDPHG